MIGEIILSVVLIGALMYFFGFFDSEYGEISIGATIVAGALVSLLKVGVLIGIVALGMLVYNKYLAPLL